MMIQSLQQIASILTAMLLSLQGTVSSLPPNTQLAQVSPTASLSVSPSISSVAVNNTFTVNVLLNTGGQAAYGVDVNRLRFNPSVLQVVDADAGTSGVQISAGSLMTLTITNTVDNSGGSIQFSQLATPGSTYSGSGTLATITFRAISAGSANVTFDFTSGSGTDTNVAGLGGDLLASVSGGTYTSTAVDTTAPVISSIGASSITTSGATVSWTTNESSDTQVEYGLTTSYGSQTTLNTSMVTSHSATLSGLSGGVTYNYRVKSRDAAGNLATSPNNTFTTATPVDTTAPTAPSGLSQTSLTSTRVDMSWAASTDSVGVTGYRIERCSGSTTCSNFTQIGTSPSTTYFDTPLSASTIYRYRVRAEDAAGNLSSYSSILTVTTPAPPDTTPPTISNVTVSSVTTSGATVSWTTNESSDTQVEYGLTTSYGSQTTLNTSMVTSHSATLSGLSPATSYNFRVKSRDAAGNISQSSNNVLTTNSLPDTTAPTVPTGLTATSTSQTQVQISWNSSTDPSASGQTVSGVSGYQVWRDGVLITTTSATAYLNTGLSQGNTYSYQVASVDVAGNVSAKTSSVSVTIPLLSLSVQRRITVSPEGAPVNNRALSGTIEFISPTTGLKVYQSSFTTDTTGKYIIDIPAGLPPTVTFRPVISGYLSKVLTSVNLTTQSLVDVVLPTQPAGDFNDDNLINSLDFSYMNTNWGGSGTLADINKDNTVNSLDFAYLSNNWLLSGE